MSVPHKCPHCGLRPMWGTHLTIYECSDCNCRYCYKCDHDRCPKCGSRDRSEWGAAFNE